jgi:hypothetical protein
MIPVLANVQVPEAVYIYKKPDECSEDICCLLLYPNRF